MQRPTGRSIFLILTGLALLLFCVLLLPRLLYPPLTPAQLRGVPSAKERIELQQIQSSLQNDARTPLLQALGGLLLVAGVIATWQQVLIGREGQITERFTRAVDQVGSAMLDVRVGGILALERIARDSERDQQPVAQLLEAFVRIHAPWRFSEPYPTPTIDRELPWLRDRAPDVQTSLWVLGTRLPRRAYDLAGLNRVDLRRSYLSEFWLPGASFWKANLARSHMRRVHLEGAQLAWVDLREASVTNGFLAKADLSHACLDDADFQGVDLQEATLVEASMRNAKLRNAKLRKARLCRADLRGTDLTGANLEGADLAGARADPTTIWPEGLGADQRRSRGVISAEEAEPKSSTASDAE